MSSDMSPINIQHQQQQGQDERENGGRRRTQTRPRYHCHHHLLMLLALGGVIVFVHVLGVAYENVDSRLPDDPTTNDSNQRRRSLLRHAVSNTTTEVGSNTIINGDRNDVNKVITFSSSNASIRITDRQLAPLPPSQSASSSEQSSFTCLLLLREDENPEANDETLQQQQQSLSYSGSSSDSSWDCQLPNGKIRTIHGIDGCLAKLRDEQAQERTDTNSRSLSSPPSATSQTISGRTWVVVRTSNSIRSNNADGVWDGDTIRLDLLSMEEIDLMEVDENDVTTSLYPSRKGSNDDANGASKDADIEVRRRRLEPPPPRSTTSLYTPPTTIGTKRVLAVIATTSTSTIPPPPPGATPFTPLDPTEVALGIFGDGNNNSDMNLRTWISQCSSGRLQMEPATGVGISNGVMAVNIVLPTQDVVESGSESSSVVITDHTTVRELMYEAIQLQTGVTDLTTLFDHVMLCLPSWVTGMGAAYAWMNHHLSVFHNRWCLSPSAQLHEIGHNLNLQHAGETGQYDDETGVMGFSSGATDGPKMCFNPANNNALDWYNVGNQALTFDPLVQGSLSTRLIGVADFDPSASSNLNAQVVVRLGNSQDDRGFYLGFNRAKGPNAGTMEGKNEVLVVTDDGLNDNFQGTQSTLLAKIPYGTSQTFPNYLDSGRNLVVDWKGYDYGPLISVYFDSCARDTDCSYLLETQTCPDGSNSQTPLATCQGGMCQFDTTTACASSLVRHVEISAQRTSSDNEDFGWVLSNDCNGDVIARSTDLYSTSEVYKTMVKVDMTTFGYTLQATGTGNGVVKLDKLDGSQAVTLMPFPFTFGDCPSNSPSEMPSFSPSLEPSQQPSSLPSLSNEPSASYLPSSLPSMIPSTSPSLSFVPSVDSPSMAPSISSAPSMIPSEAPSPSPTVSTLPSSIPSVSPSEKPSNSPSVGPSNLPSTSPSLDPSSVPSLTPSTLPSATPSNTPSAPPSEVPSGTPSRLPSFSPSNMPSQLPSSYPSNNPSEKPSDVPSGTPSAIPSSGPSDQPSSFPSNSPSAQPSSHPSDVPSPVPSASPSGQPSSGPSTSPSAGPSVSPSGTPSVGPSSSPSAGPSANPSSSPSAGPSNAPSSGPSTSPSNGPSRSFYPSSTPSIVPTDSHEPSGSPSTAPTGSPSNAPSDRPSSSISPSQVPTESVAPSVSPSVSANPSWSSFPSSSPSEDFVLFRLEISPSTGSGNETSWALWDVCKNVLVDGSPTMETGTEVILQLRPNNEYQLMVYDSSSDGLCPLGGPLGDLTLSLDGQVVPEVGPCFGEDLSYSFGECDVMARPRTNIIGV